MKDETKNEAGTEKKISRREALKRMAKAGTIFAGVAVLSTALSGCYIDYQDHYSDYSDYSDYSNSYSDYSDYGNSYGDYNDSYSDSYGDYGG